MSSSQNKALELYKMKQWATGLLVVAFVVFLVSSLFAEQYVWVGFVQATAEAAMVGAIADWFAITALFRHPLGIKIPHTAIIPRRKERIAKNFGRFVREKFLSQAVISQKLVDMKVTHTLAEWLSQPQNSAFVADRITENVAAAATVIRDEAVQTLLEEKLAQQIRSTNFAPMVGHLLALIMSGDRKQEIFYSIVKVGSSFIKDNKAVIVHKINAELPFLIRGLDKTIYRKLVDAVDNTLQEVNADPEHPLHENFNVLVERYIEDLKTSPDILAKEQGWKEELLQHPAFKAFSSSLWLDVKESLMQPRPDRDIRPTIQHALINFAETIQHDPVLFEKVDRWLTEAISYLTQTYGYEVENLITSTIEQWDADQASQEIEYQVGRDLQFIRINGTVIGGLLGFLIHTLGFLIKYLGE